MSERYEGKPLLRLLEYYVMWAIGEISAEDEARLTAMTPKLSVIYGGEGSWQDVLAGAMHLPPNLAADLRRMWTSNREKARSAGLTLMPQDFAEMIVDENFA